MSNINITNKEGQLLVSSREVASNFKKNHQHVLRDLDLIEEGVQNWTDLFYETTYIHEQNKQEYREILMTRDGFTLLAMGFTGQKALQWKIKYIEAFNKMEQALKEKDKPLEINSKLMYQLAQTLEEKEKQIALMQPKALFADAVSTSKTSILVGELAKLLKQNGIEMGQNRLFDWLRDNEFLIKRRGTDYNMPTQKSMEMELFEIKETSISKPDGHILISKTPKVTGKGQVYFINKFLREV